MSGATTTSASRFGPLHDLRGLLALVAVFVPIGLGLALFFAYPSPWTFALSFLVTAGRQHAMTILGHECYHSLLFHRRRTNDLVGAWLLSFPIVLRYEPLRQKHFEHHRKLGQREDPDRYFWGWSSSPRGGFVLHHLFVLLGVDFCVHVTRTLLGLRAPEGPPEERPRALRFQPTPGGGREMAAVAATQLALLAAFSLTVGWVWYLALWLAPAVTLGSLLGHLRQLLEHPGGALTVYRSPWPERWFLAPFGFHLHGFHHLFPSVPWYSLHALEGEARAKAPDLVVRGTYLGGLVTHLRTAPDAPPAATAAARGEVILEQLVGPAGP